MQEDINNRTVTLVIQANKLMARLVMRAVEKALAAMKEQQRAVRQKQAVRSGPALQV
ncbi:hypothetical protein [Clostridioides sp. ZZV14-6345]|uniref:hypothetical protein n=1 Tax=Clostridioides sp. ZZV14-6345 TaxID=2811496 RepID=UPI001D1017FE|nr:hypothetical protein [Clostridioides sp. ZZV14-6345]